MIRKEFTQESIKVSGENYAIVLLFITAYSKAFFSYFHGYNTVQAAVVTAGLWWKSNIRDTLGPLGIGYFIRLTSFIG
jgi:hypothetical protein